MPYHNHGINHKLIVPDPCDREPCDINADCEREGLLSANFTCSCRDPFSDGDGFKIRLSSVPLYGCIAITGNDVISVHWERSI